MSDFTFVKTDKAPGAIGPYSQAVAVDGWVYCSGQIPLDPSTGELVEGDIAMVTLLLSRDADPNARASYDRTPLFFAERGESSAAIAELLRKHGTGDENAQPSETDEVSF